MSQRVRNFVVAILAGLAISGCGEDQYFQLGLILPDGDPPPCQIDPPGKYGFYSFIVWQDDDVNPIGCYQAPCRISNQEPRDCLLGVDTPPLEPGQRFRIKVMLHGAPPGNEPIMCGQNTMGEVDFDSIKLDVPLHCAATCTEQWCNLSTCAAERDRWCPGFTEE